VEDAQPPVVGGKKKKSPADQKKKRHPRRKGKIKEKNAHRKKDPRRKLLLGRVWYKKRSSGTGGGKTPSKGYTKKKTELTLCRGQRIRIVRTEVHACDAKGKALMKSRSSQRGALSQRQDKEGTAIFVGRSPCGLVNLSGDASQEGLLETMVSVVNRKNSFT